MNLVKKNLPLVGGGASLPGYYKNFYFVPRYALEQMYFGVSSKAEYYGFRIFFSDIISYSNDKRFVKDYNQFYPKPDQFISYSHFIDFFKGILEGTESFYFLKPNTFSYDFFVGFFFVYPLAVWWWFSLFTLL